MRNDGVDGATGLFVHVLHEGFSLLDPLGDLFGVVGHGGEAARKLRCFTVCRLAAKGFHPLAALLGRDEPYDRKARSDRTAKTFEAGSGRSPFDEKALLRPALPGRVPVINVLWDPGARDPRPGFGISRLRQLVQ